MGVCGEFHAALVHIVEKENDWTRRTGGFYVLAIPGSHSHGQHHVIVRVLSPRATVLSFALPSGTLMQNKL